MSADEERLLDLNRQLFRAESHDPAGGWMNVLHRSLADDFRLRRAIGELEDRERMIARVSRSEPAVREVVEEQVAVLGETAVVRSLVQLGAASFRNAKLFENVSGEWRCVYWRVSRE